MRATLPSVNRVYIISRTGTAANPPPRRNAAAQANRTARPRLTTLTGARAQPAAGQPDSEKSGNTRRCRGDERKINRARREI